MRSYFLYLFVGKMRTKAGVHFVQLLEDDDVAFDNLFCVAFQVLDSQWLARRASYMEFNVSILYQDNNLCMLMVSHIIIQFELIISMSILSGGSEVYTGSVRARAYYRRYFSHSRHAIIQNAEKLALFILHRKRDTFQMSIGCLNLLSILSLDVEDVICVCSSMMP